MRTGIGASREHYELLLLAQRIAGVRHTSTESNALRNQRVESVLSIAFCLELLILGVSDESELENIVRLLEIDVL